MRGVLCLLLCVAGVGNVWGEDVTVTFDASKQGYDNAEVITHVAVTEDIIVVFDKGTNSNACKYYDTGNAIRVYGGGYFTITSTIGKIKKIKFTFGTGDGTNEITKDCGKYNSSNNEWEGLSESIKFTVGGSSGHRRIKSIAVTYQKNASAPVITSLSFSGMPTNTAYYVDDTPSAEGLVVEATYDDQSSKDVTPYVSWSFIPEQITKETKTITAIASYENLSAETSFAISLKSIANEAENAYSVTEAYDIIDVGRGLSEEVYVKGIVSQVESFNSTNGSISYWISEDGTLAGKQFQCYGGLDLDGNQFTSIDDLKLGTVVIVRGILKKYNDIYEFDKNNVIVLKDESNIKTLSSIEISGSPVKTSYVIGETPTADGLIVNAIYSDNSKIDVTDDVIWTFNPEVIVEGITEVVITAKYKELTISYIVEIIVQDYTPIYNLIPVKGGLNGYATESLINIDDVTWHILGNTQMLPWRFGGKSLDKVDREIKCATPIKGIFGKVVVSVGETSKSITLNKIKLSVANNAEFENAQIYEHTNNLRANTEHTFDITPTTDGYYKITFNVTVSATSNNKYYEFLGATFYRTDNITIGSAGYATFSLPYNATVPDGLTAYAASQHGESIKLTKIESAKIAAGEGVVLKGEEGTYTFIATAEDVMPADNNLMVGVTKDTELVATDKAYLLTRKKDDGSIAFRLLNNNYTLGANKAYLKLKDCDAGESRNLIPALWEEETTSIVDLSNVNKGSGRVYNLSGQRLLELQRGINIVDGKLVIK